MSSTPTPTQAVEAIALPMGKASPATLVIEYRPMTDSPEQAELQVFFDMLDTVHKNSPFGQWEH